MAKFARLGDVFLYAEPDRRKRAKQILWGDWLNVEDERDDGWSKVRWGRERLWIPREDYRDERPLEVIFLDVGQGDGCLLVTPETGPDERVMLIDAGERDNMFGFLKWRFGKLRRDFRFHAAIITHPDQDHYKGFQRIFEQEAFSFDRVYHNGIAERSGPDRLGPSDASGRYLTDLLETDDDARALYGEADAHPRMIYPKLMRTALSSGRVGSVEMLSTAHGERQDGRAWLPGFAPGSGAGVTIEILGPVVEPDDDGKARLRWFGDTPDATSPDIGKTKNGHSVILRLCYRDFTLLFGGDLNRPAETFLLRHYGNGGRPPTPDGTAAMVQKARGRFRSDVMKSCHHGSSDVTDEFLQAVHPFAFVVSSGDEESHAHPRPDLLGRLGKQGRGDSPLILCTEILRSTREREDRSLYKKLDRIEAQLEDAGLDADRRKALKAERKAILDEVFRRNVGVYGAITLRTDGRDLLVAFRMEKERPSGKKRWQTYHYRFDAQHGFVLVPENGGH